MLNEKNLATGVQQNTSYIGHHRDATLAKGVGLIPLGDRNRARFEFGVDVLEERDSIDQYQKYLPEL